MKIVDKIRKTLNNINDLKDSIFHTRLKVQKFMYDDSSLGNPLPDLLALIESYEDQLEKENEELKKLVFKAVSEDDM